MRLLKEVWTTRHIAWEFGILRTTANEFLSAGDFPERKGVVPGRNRVEPDAPFLRQRWDDGCHNAKQLWRKFWEQGFTGGSGSVCRFT